MGLNVPVGVSVAGLVILGAGDFNLLETPLRQVDIASAKVATQDLMLQAKCRSQSPDLAPIPRSSIADNLNLPVILFITNSGISVRRNLPIGLGEGSGNLVRVKVAASLGMEETDSGAITNEAGLLGSIILGIAAVRVEEPVVVGIFVVIASNLLLVRTLRVSLDVAVE